MPTISHKVLGDQSFVDIAISEIQVGDKILVRPGEITPTDGTLLDRATLDESALTGESIPIEHRGGDLISSGVINAGAPFLMSATATSAESTYSGIIKLVEQAQAKNSPGIRIANQWAARFLPLALAMAALTYFITGDIKRVVAVLVAATPCPLILAVPIAIVSGLSNAAKHGAIVKGGSILEALGRTEVVLLDKTGTLTHGGPAITEINTRLGMSSDEVLALAASVDQLSPHIVAQAIVKEAHRREVQLSAVSEVVEVAGHHIQGNIGDRVVRVGQLTQDRPPWLHFNLPLMVSIEIDGELVGVIGLADPIRAESRAMVNDLRKAGVQHIALVTGDRDVTAQEVAQFVGISEVYSQVSAEGKLQIAENAKKKYQGTVVVVGDGINDAPALALADVGVAMGARGASAASEAADVVIVDDSIDRLTQAIRISQRSRQKALQSAGLGMSLSLVAMTLGAFGTLSPSAGAIAQELIDVAAILWALTTLLHKAK